MGQSESIKKELPSQADQIFGTIFGQCIGDAIGLLTEFMTKAEAEKYYRSKVAEGLEYTDKVPDMHRARWEVGDWTDDSDQMLAIMQSVIDNNGKVVPVDVGQKLFTWMKHGIAQLGDSAGMGLGRTTATVLRHPEYSIDPHKCAYEVWDSSQRNIAPNGAVMRTSILGVLQFHSYDAVVDNAVKVCKTTHADPRCVASCVAVAVAIAAMLNRYDTRFIDSNNCFNVALITEFAFNKAVVFIEDQGQREELKAAMFAKNLKKLELCSAGKIGYTLKALGAGFWALRQNDFRSAMTELVMEGGDADTNGAVAGALLGCKIGRSNLPANWLYGLRHKEWLENKMDEFMALLVKMRTMLACEIKMEKVSNYMDSVFRGPVLLS